MKQFSFTCFTTVKSSDKITCCALKSLMCILRCACRGKAPLWASGEVLVTIFHGKKLTFVEKVTRFISRCFVFFKRLLKGCEKLVKVATEELSWQHRLQMPSSWHNRNNSNDQWCSFITHWVSHSVMTTAFSVSNSKAETDQKWISNVFFNNHVSVSVSCYIEMTNIFRFRILEYEYIVFVMPLMLYVIQLLMIFWKYKNKINTQNINC